MGRSDMLLAGLDHAYDQFGWYPPLQSALKGLTPSQALERPEGLAGNNIWETVHHLIFYKERWIKRLRGEDPGPVADNDLTFEVKVQADAEKDWRETLSNMERVQTELRQTIASLTEERLNQTMFEVPLDHILIDLVLHDAYHTGQIVLIRKMQGSWPAKQPYE